MTFKVAVETLDSVRRRLAVEVPAEEVQAEIEKAYAKLGRDAKVHGFRPGRVPRQVLERLFGDRIRGEVFGRLIHQSYVEVIEERHIEALGQPEFVTEQAEPGAALRYSATVEVKPEITVESYRDLEVERPLSIVTEADIDAYMERLRQSLAQLRPITDRQEAQRGDVVTLDYEATVDGREVDRAEGREVEIGASGFPPQFEERLVGAAVGAELSFAVTHATDPAAPELPEKTVQFHVRLRGLSQKEVPQLDDEFAKDHGECSTLEELRQRVRQQLESDAGRRADEAVRRALAVRLADTHDIPVPTALVQGRIEAMIAEVMSEWQRRRIQPRNRADAIARLRGELEPQARQQVKIALLLEAIARQEGVSVDDHEVAERIEALAAASGFGAERVRAAYQSAEARRQLCTQLLHARTLEAVARTARIHTTQRTDSVAEADENG